MVEAFPLCWPVGYKREPRPQNSRFNTAFAKSKDAIIKEVRLFGGRECIISSNIPTKRDGNPYANFSQPIDKGIAVYFTYGGEQVVFACDKWNRCEDNLQAIRKAIEAFRGLEMWGVSDLLKRAFTGFKALPEQTAGRKWWEAMDLDKNASQEEIKVAYRRLVKIHHPDNGWRAEDFRAINEAYQQAILNPH
jgi:hypothetical protein